MRVMVIVKASQDSEAGVPPRADLLAEMGAYNEELVKAGILLAGEGLADSSKGVRVVFAKGKQKVIDGPFAETKELIAGFWLWQVHDMAEAVAWLRRMPQADENEYAVEIRRVLEAEDFGDAMTPELRALEDRLRAETASKSK